MGGGKAVAGVLSEQVEASTFQTRTKKSARDFLLVGHMFVCLLHDRDFAGLHAVGQPLQLALTGGLNQKWCLAVVKSRIYR